jgi:hypothetical protein
MSGIPTTVIGLLFLLAWLFLISLPGLGLTYLGWRLSRALQPTWAQTFLRATLIAIMLTPTIYGHTGPVPAILVVLGGSGKEKIIGILPILVVWTIAVPAVSIFAKKRERGRSAPM